MSMKPLLAAVFVLGASVAPAFSQPAPHPDPPSSTAILQSVDRELARLAASDTAADALRVQARPARKPNWFRRHPVATASIGGFLTGFAAGWAMGDDGVFDDFTGEFNGVMVGGIVAGSAASVVGIAHAFRK